MARENNSLVFGFHCAKYASICERTLKHLSVKSEAGKGSSYAECVMWVFRLSFEKASVWKILRPKICRASY